MIVHYLPTFKVSRPWVCALGHDNVSYAAACATKKVLLRAYVRNA